jgi:transposase
MKETKATGDVNLELKSLVFQMHVAGYSQNAIAAYVGKSKSIINEMLKPLQKRKDD